MCIIPAMRAKCHWCEDAGRSCSPWEWLSVPESCPSTPSSLPSCLTSPRLQPQKSSHILGLSRCDNSSHVHKNGNFCKKKKSIIISIVFFTSEKKIYIYIQFHYWSCPYPVTNISSLPFSGVWTHKSPSRLCRCHDQASTRWTRICVLKDHSALSIWWISLNCYL